MTPSTTVALSCMKVVVERQGDDIDLPQLLSVQMGCNSFVFNTDSHTLLVLQSRADWGK